MSANQLPFEVFDATYAVKDGIFYSKQSNVFITKLEKHFKIKASDFLWIDDNAQIADDISAFGSHYVLVSKTNSLKNILTSLLQR